MVRSHTLAGYSPACCNNSDKTRRRRFRAFRAIRRIVPCLSRTIPRPLPSRVRWIARDYLIVLLPLPAQGMAQAPPQFTPPGDSLGDHLIAGGQNFAQGMVMDERIARLHTHQKNIDRYDVLGSETETLQ